MWPGSRAWTRQWLRRQIAFRSAQIAVVVSPQGYPIRIHWQLTVPNWRNNQVADQCISRSQGLRHTASVRPVGDIEFRCDFMTCQEKQAIATWWLMQNGLQLLQVISAVAKLQLIYWPLLMVLPITLS